VVLDTEGNIITRDRLHTMVQVSLLTLCSPKADRQ